MKTLNRAQLMGHLGTDPETKEFKGGVVTKFTLATGETWIDKETNEKKRVPSGIELPVLDNLQKV